MSDYLKSFAHETRALSERIESPIKLFVTMFECKFLQPAPARNIGLSYCFTVKD